MLWKLGLVEGLVVKGKGSGSTDKFKKVVREKREMRNANPEIRNLALWEAEQR